VFIQKECDAICFASLGPEKNGNSSVLHSCHEPDAAHKILVAKPVSTSCAHRRTIPARLLVQEWSTMRRTVPDVRGWNTSQTLPVQVNHKVRFTLESSR
jgi:hypothetical protein